MRKNKNYSISMSVELMEQIKELAKNNKVSTSKFIQTVMQEYVNQVSSQNVSTVNG